MWPLLSWFLYIVFYIMGFLMRASWEAISYQWCTDNWCQTINEILIRSDYSYPGVYPRWNLVKWTFSNKKDFTFKFPLNSLHWVWWNTGTYCPECCGVFLSGDFLNTSAHVPVKHHLGVSVLAWGVGQDDLQMFLLSPAILWLCNSHNSL